MFIFPGLGLGASVSGAVRITDATLYASALALAKCLTDDERAAGQVFPSVRRRRLLARFEWSLLRSLLVGLFWVLGREWCWFRPQHTSPLLFPSHATLAVYYTMLAQVSRIRDVSEEVALAVVEATAAQGLATRLGGSPGHAPPQTSDELRAHLRRKTYNPFYVPLGADPYRS